MYGVISDVFVPCCCILSLGCRRWPGQDRGGQSATCESLLGQGCALCPGLTPRASGLGSRLDGAVPGRGAGDQLGIFGSRESSSLLLLMHHPVP